MQSQQRGRRTARLEARVTAEQKEMIDLAAAYEGRSVSDFVVQTVQQAAKAIVREHETLRLNRRQSELLVEALVKPPKPNDELRRAAKDYRRRVRQA